MRLSQTSKHADAGWVYAAVSTVWPANSITPLSTAEASEPLGLYSFYIALEAMRRPSCLVCYLVLYTLHCALHSVCLSVRLVQACNLRMEDIRKFELNAQIFRGTYMRNLQQVIRLR